MNFLHFLSIHRDIEVGVDGVVVIFALPLENLLECFEFVDWLEEDFNAAEVARGVLREEVLVAVRLNAQDGLALAEAEPVRVHGLAHQTALVLHTLPLLH